MSNLNHSLLSELERKVEERTAELRCVIDELRAEKN